MAVFVGKGKAYVSFKMAEKRKKWILCQYCDILKRMNAEVEYEL